MEDIADECNERMSATSSVSPPASPSPSLHTATSSRARFYPVICDVMRLETIRERNSVYSEDGEFIDLPLPPVPQCSNAPKGDNSGEEGFKAMATANAYLKSRLHDFEDDDEVISNGYASEGNIATRAASDRVTTGVPCSSHLVGMKMANVGILEDDLKSIDSSTASNTLRKSSWSVTSTGSTGGECSNRDYKRGCASESVDSDECDQPEEDEYGEQSSGYRDKSPFLRSISLSPVERRYRKQSVNRERRRRHPAGRQPSGAVDSWRRHNSMPHGDQDADDSTCCDDDFTWVYSRDGPTAPKASVESDRRSLLTTASRSVSRDQRSQEKSQSQSHHQRQSSGSTSIGIGEVVPSGKPPRPSRETGSLDRRRHLSSSRRERDGKSRSTHSLKEKSSSSEFNKHDSMSSNLSLNSKDQLHGSGSIHNYNSSGSGSYSQHHPYQPHSHNSRLSPSIWEPPPPPPLSPWDPHYYWSYQHHHHLHQSREELRLIDYHRRQQELCQRGSNSALGSTQDLSCSSNCCNRNFYHYPPPGPCCSLDHRAQCNNDNQRQDTDERLRRLQTDKESLALQVKTLSEQVQSQSSKISELESVVKEKNQLLSNAEDLLQREMLSRSSLETQKLELMSAMSELKLQQAALERENLELRTNFVTSTGGSAGLLNGSLSNGNVTGSTLTNVLNNNSITSSLLRRPQIITNTRMVGMSASGSGTSLISSPIHHGSHGSLPQSAVSPITPKTPPATYRQRIDVHYSSLPRQAFATTLSTVSTSSGSSTTTDSNANPKRNVVFAETENRDIGIPDQTEGVMATRSFTPQPSPSPSMSNKLKTIFGKIKRSNSGTLDDMTSSDGEFKRGGVRATAGARLGWSGTTQYRKPDKPFREWSLDAICQWFDHLGLGMYEEELRRWLNASTAPGVELIKASPVDFEKELALRNPLHRKKIVLAITDVSGAADDDDLLKCAGKLDTAWIQSWLDDVGMPQYKDIFIAARMDGRMLHKLTMDDLAHLQITSCLHVASIRRAIQLMRHEKWNAGCLIRRPAPLDAKDDVRLWTSQRVHEWLRVVDLAEYAPNLRGSGVHGALMIFEVKFTAELFADLLNIPTSKTLLRRHLATHFKELLGREIIQVKREAENTLGFQPLTISAKIKTPKKSQFSLKRKKSSKGGQLDEWSDYVCPMGGSGQEHLPTPSSTAYAATSINQSGIISAATAFTSKASSVNTNTVTTIGMTKDPSMVPTAYPDSTTSSTTSTTTSGAGSEHASLHRLPSSNNGSQSMAAILAMNNNGGGGSDSPISARSSTTSTS